MPLDFQPVQIIFDGLDQKVSRKLHVPGKLESAINVEYDKDGGLNKRRGYRRVVVSDTALGSTGEAVFSEVATYQDELVVFGEEFVYSVGAIVPALGTPEASTVFRGPVLRGCYRVLDVVAAGIGDEQ